MNSRVALISGASRGIGRAIAAELARRGIAVAVGFLTRENEAQAAVAAIESQGGRAMAVSLDIGDPSACIRAAASTKDRFGSLDILINNAAVADDAPALAMELSAWHRIIEINLTGAFHLSRACARFMVPRRWGRIINISSVVARVGGRGQANYAAAKAGLEGLTRALAVELAPRNILVNAVAPGTISTDLSQPLLDKHRQRILSNVLLERPGLPTEVAGLVGFLASDEASYITGQTIRVDGGFGLNL